jgi:hypothetical protein
MIGSFERLFEQTRPAFAQDRTFERARTLAMSSLVGLGRRTVSGLLCAGAQQFQDWSAAYRLFERERFERQALFDPARRAVQEHLGQDEPLVVMMDDTLVRKRGKKVHGTGWRRDPLGPPFCSNFVWGQRFLQLSAAFPDQMQKGRARGIPIELIHAPSPKKPRKKAEVAEWEEYRRKQKMMKVSSVGAKALQELRCSLDSDPFGGDRGLVVAVDGGFTNREVFRNIPRHTTVIGRIRKDARLFLAPPAPESVRRGRPRWFGEPLPTPEQIRRDDSIPWIKVEAFGAGQMHSFEVKTIPEVRWLGSGERNVRLVVVRPLAYRPRKGAALLYRDPVYLLCTDPQLSLDKLLQAYLWRWEIELNFREEKTLLGVGEAQVRTPAAVEAVPSLIVAAYAFMLLAASEAGNSAYLPPPKWRQRKLGERDSAATMLGHFRAQLWGKAMGVNLTHFDQKRGAQASASLIKNPMSSAVCYAFR